MGQLALQLGLQKNMSPKNQLNSADIPIPFDSERPTDYADRVGAWYASTKSVDHRKSLGLYLTPGLIADFMASLVTISQDKVHILDPSAGAGILACAVVEHLVKSKGKQVQIDLVAFEVDQGLEAPLNAVLEYLVKWCNNIFSASIRVKAICADFILDSGVATEEKQFDVIIANPPYFKVAKNGPHALAVSSVVHGQPNIYALFMAASAQFLRLGGQLVFITPRSFASGLYFLRFRQKFFRLIRPYKIHVFGSRRQAFRRDDVLQENIILAGIREDWNSKADFPIDISNSLGVDDLKNRSRNRFLPMNQVLDLNSPDRILRLPVTSADDEVMAYVDSWPETLESLDLTISTGPVVPFRAKDLIDRVGKVPQTHVPLLWMNHVQTMQLTWPLNHGKNEYIRLNSSGVLVIPNINYVLLRRFSAKDEKRRLTAAPYIASKFKMPVIGIENHLNYIHRRGGVLAEAEVWGLAALLNSKLLDAYFRCINGNTQVNASELRSLPLPPLNVIIALGKSVKNLQDYSQLDEMVKRQLDSYKASKAS